jgi:hypothetical protein
MHPDLWGPGAWTFLHSITFNYPKEPTSKHKEVHAHFFNALPYVLPCEKCAYHLSENLKKYPIEEVLDDKDEFVKWLIHIHNEVNVMLNKPIRSQEEVIQEYKKELNEITGQYISFQNVLIALIVIVCMYLLLTNKIQIIF